MENKRLFQFLLDDIRKLIDKAEENWQSNDGIINPIDFKDDIDFFHSYWGTHLPTLEQEMLNKC